MGTLDTLLIVGTLGIGAWYVITHKDELFPPKEPDDTTTDTGGDFGEGEDEGVSDGEGGNGGGDKDYDCAKACRNCWCKSYNEKCSGNCSRCKGGNRVASKCGLDGSSSSKETNGSFGSGGDSCSDLCSKGWCESYRKKCSPCKCGKCCGGSGGGSSGSGSGSKGIISGKSSGSTKSSCPCSSKCAGTTGAMCDLCCKANVAYAYHGYLYGQVMFSNVYS